MAVVIVNGIFYLIIRSGVNRRYKYPNMMFPQTAFMIIAPHVGHLFLINQFFIIYVVDWLIGLLALVLAFILALGRCTYLANMLNRIQRKMT